MTGSHSDLEDVVPTSARRWDERVEAWAKAQDVDERSKRTYAEHLRRFPRYLEQLGFSLSGGAAGVTREEILAFKHEGVGYSRREGQPLALTTRAMDLCLLRSFLGWEASQMKRRHRSGVLALVVDEKLFRFRPGRVQPSPGRRMESADEVAAVIANAPSDEARAVLVLGLYGGLRPGEARAVRVGDLELSLDRRSVVRIARGKWGKPRVVQLPRHARNLILAAVVAKDRCDRVYPFSRSKQGRDLAEACDRAGTSRYTPHDLRRTYAAMMFEAGAPLEAVQDQLGHADPRTTRLYQGPVRVARAVEQLEQLLGV